MMWLSLVSLLTCAGAEATVTRRSVTLDVIAAPSVPSAVVQIAIDEAIAIWNGAGVAVELAAASPARPSAERLNVRVIVDDEQGVAPGNETPLGWIMFDPSGLPERVIHVSHRNVVRLLDAIASYRERPAAQRELFMGRALGRALAHELGHYVFASKAHTSAGLMRGQRSTNEFFAPTRSGFQFDDRQRELVARELGVDRGASCATSRAGGLDPSEGSGSGLVPAVGQMFGNPAVTDRSEVDGARTAEPQEQHGANGAGPE